MFRDDDAVTLPIAVSESYPLASSKYEPESRGVIKPLKRLEMPQLSGEQRALAVDLTAAALVRLAPDELPVLADTAADFYADPDAILRRDRADSPLGAGIEVVMLSPYLLA